MRRLREPGKIHRRRRNCSARAVTLLLRLSGEVSQAFIRRVPCPQGWRLTRSVRPTVPRAGNLFVHIIPQKWKMRRNFSRSQRRGRRRYAGHLSAISNFATLPKSGLRHENSRERSPPAGLPGLSQPGLRLVALQYTGERRESDKRCNVWQDRPRRVYNGVRSHCVLYS